MNQISNEMERRKIVFFLSILLACEAHNGATEHVSVGETEKESSFCVPIADFASAKVCEFVFVLQQNIAIHAAPRRRTALRKRSSCMHRQSAHKGVEQRGEGGGRQHTHTHTHKPRKLLCCGIHATGQGRASQREKIARVYSSFLLHIRRRCAIWRTRHALPYHSCTHQGRSTYSHDASEMRLACGSGNGGNGL